MPITQIAKFDRAMDWPIKAIMAHFETRLFELAMTLAMLAIAGWVMAWPTSISDGSFEHFRYIMRPELAVGMFMLLGMARIIALIANGHWIFYGPIIRAASAGIAAFVWAQMAAALFLWAGATGKPPSISIPLYATLAAFELISMYRALARANVKRGSHEAAP